MDFKTTPLFLLIMAWDSVSGEGERISTLDISTPAYY